MRVGVRVRVRVRVRVSVRGGKAATPLRSGESASPSLPSAARRARKESSGASSITLAHFFRVPSFRLCLSRQLSPRSKSSRSRSALRKTLFFIFLRRGVGAAAFGLDAPCASPPELCPGAPTAACTAHG